MHIFRRFALFMVVLFAVFEINCGGAMPGASKSDPTSPPSGNSPGGNNSGSGGQPSGGGSNSPGTTLSDLHGKGGWTGYGELPPDYAICSSCKPSGPNVTWSMQQGVASPSLSGSATNFTIGGQEAYSDVIWINHLIGDLSSQNLPDNDHSLDQATHNFIYDTYFYGDDLTKAEALEFDINQYVDGKSFIWGTQCRIANGANWWDISINQGHNWQPTGFPCNVKEKDWNHVIIQVQRTSDDKLLFQTITLNGQVFTLNYEEDPGSSDWHGVTINYQEDGDHAQDQYSVFLDKLNFTYW